jgi:Ca2+-binding RTX toxin-like protein
MLVVDGTQGNDSIRIDRGNKPNRVMVTVNGVPFGPFKPSSRIVSFGSSGNDKITVAPKVKLSAWLDGGDGNDVLKGGSGPNVILGGAGNDALIGGVSRDLLIGGTGQDVMFGKKGGDILIAGTTSFDNSQTALDAVMKEWTSTHSYKQRVSNLTGVLSKKFGKRLNGNVFLAPATVQNDDGSNVAVSGRGRGLLFVDDAADVIVDQTRRGRG